jgi:hypothetical protein
MEKFSFERGIIDDFTKVGKQLFEGLLKNCPP